MRSRPAKGDPVGRKQVTTGLLLVASGTLLLLVQRDVVELESVWRYWPVALIVVGIIKLVAPGQGRDLPNGTLETLAGLWFLACNLNWLGFTYRETWPLVLVAIGLSQAVKALQPGRAAVPPLKEDGHA